MFNEFLSCRRRGGGRYHFDGESCYGGRMPRKKAPGTAADKRNGSRFAMVQADGYPQFDLPDDLVLVPAAEEAWENYWFDPVSAILNQSDYVLVYRWIVNLNRYFRAVEEADESRVGGGASGQPLLNPLYQVARDALAAAERVERQLGMGPSNRSRLGIELVQADGAMKDHRLRRGPEPDQVTIERADPREGGDE